MAWDKGKYYTLSRKVRGRVVREYTGCGEIGEIAAKTDELERQRRHSQRELETLEREEILAVDLAFSDLCRMVSLLQEAALASEGFNCHRGEWRKRRVGKRSS